MLRDEITGLDGTAREVLLEKGRCTQMQQKYIRTLLMNKPDVPLPTHQIMCER
jgi:hypothetical protein